MGAVAIELCLVQGNKCCSDHKKPSSKKRACFSTDYTTSANKVVLWSNSCIGGRVPTNANRLLDQKVFAGACAQYVSVQLVYRNMLWACANKKLFGQATCNHNS